MTDNYSKWRTREGIKSLPEFDRGDDVDDAFGSPPAGSRAPPRSGPSPGGWLNSGPHRPQRRHRVRQVGERQPPLQRRHPGPSRVACRPAQSASASSRREIRFSTGVSSAIGGEHAGEHQRGRARIEQAVGDTGAEPSGSSSRQMSHSAGSASTPNQSTPLSVCRRWMCPNSCAISARSCGWRQPAQRRVVDHDPLGRAHAVHERVLLGRLRPRVGDRDRPRVHVHARLEPARPARPPADARAAARSRAAADPTAPAAARSPPRPPIQAASPTASHGSRDRRGDQPGHRVDDADDRRQ